MAGLELWWIGQSGYRLRDLGSGTTLFVDPFISNHDHRTWQAPVGPAELAAADAVLCTHEHIDHFDRPALAAAAARPDARFTVVVPQPIAGEAEALGVPADRVIGMQPGEAATVAGATIHAVPASHGVHVADAYNFGEDLSGGLVRYLGFVVDLGGARVYHAGDTIPYPGQAETLRRLGPHVALLPINGRDYYRETEDLVGNLNTREAGQLAHDMHAQVLVPMHWEMFPGNLGYPADLVAQVAADFPDLTVLIPGRGARFMYVPPDDGA